MRHLGVGAPGVNSAAGFDQGRNIITDSSGNTYLLGDTTGSFASATGGSSDVYLAKFDVNGTLQWNKQFTPATFPTKITSAAGSDYAYGITLDSNDNPIVAGHCNSNLNGSFTAGVDIFVAKLTPSGDMTWIQMINSNLSASILDSSGTENVAAMSSDSSGNLYLSGSVTTGFASAYGGGATDGVIIKLDSGGNLVWVRQLNNPTFGAFLSGAGGDEYVYRISARYNGYVYFSGVITTGIITGFALAGGGNDAFVGKLDSNGNMQWIKPITSTLSALVDTTGTETCFGLEVDSTGSAIITGSTNWEVEVGPVYAGGQDMWIAKLDSTGSLTWVRQVVTAMSALVLAANLSENPRSVNVDSSNNIYITGMTDSAFFGANGGGPLGDIYIMKLNSSGTLLWGRQVTPALSPLITDASNIDGASRAWTDSNGNIAVTGDTYSNFGLTNGGNSDPYIIHMDYNGNM